MAAPTLLCLHGDLLIIGYRPSGNQIQFRPRNPELLGELPRGEGARIGRDGTVRLLLDGLDAPEVDWDGAAQPFAAESRAALLGFLGFEGVAFDGATVVASEMERVPVLLLARRVDATGRLRAFALPLPEDGSAPADGAWVPVEADSLEPSANAVLLRGGHSYLSLSESIAPVHRERLREWTRAARAEPVGVWSRDATPRFELENEASIGPAGSLVLPRLFRRSVLYLRRRHDADESLPEWLRRSTSEGHTLDDEVLRPDGRRIRLSALLTQEGTTVAFGADPADVVFVETSRSPALREEQELALKAALDEPQIRRALEESGLPLDVVHDDAMQALNASGAVEAALERTLFDPEAQPDEGPTTVAVVLGFVAVSVAVATAVVAALVDQQQPGLKLALGAGLAAMVAAGTQARLKGRAADASEGAIGVNRRNARERVLREAALPEVRASINRLRYPSFSLHLAPPSSAGLDDLLDSEYDVVTAATGRLEAMFERLTAGSLGISGNRGAGKTTLLRRACEGRIPVGDSRARVGVLVAAPVRYEAREFVPFLFASLCLQLLGPVEDVDRRRRALRERQRATRVLWASAAAVIALSVVVVLRPDWHKLTGNAGLLTIALVAAALLALAAVVVPRALRRHGAMQRLLAEDPLHARAREELETLRWVESRSEEWSTEVSAKVAKVAGKSGVTRSAQAVTLPELIHRYRRFVTDVAAQGSVIIGIDELDKMASTDDARRFLNDIKTLFGMPRVFNLVSLSDDAMSEYERRGLPIRDVLDSVFDDVLRIDYLKAEESERLLRRRVIGMPAPFAALAHVLSGGLPREMLRVARAAVRAAEDRSRNDLAQVALAVIGERVQAREAGAEAIARHHVGADGSQPILTWLRGLPPVTDGACLLERCVVAPLLMHVRATAGEGEDGLELMILELGSFWYHAATVLQFFERLDEDAFRLAQEGDPSVIEVLARGYRDLGSAPELAWRTIGDARSRIAGVAAVDYPLDPVRFTG